MAKPDPQVTAAPSALGDVDIEGTGWRPGATATVTIDGHTFQCPVDSTGSWAVRDLILADDTEAAVTVGRAKRTIALTRAATE